MKLSRASTCIRCQAELPEGGVVHLELAACLLVLASRVATLEKWVVQRERDDRARRWKG